MRARSVAVAAFLLAAAFPVLAAPRAVEDWAAWAKRAKVGLADAVDRGMKAAGSGVPYSAELEPDGDRVVWSIDVAQGAKTRNVVVDAASGEIVEDVLEEDDASKTVAPFGKVGLKEGAAAAGKESGGTPVHARFRLEGSAPRIAVTVVDGEGKARVVEVDGATGRVVGAAAPPADRPFTSVFAEDKADLGPTGDNPWFVLQPGRFWVMEGPKGSGTLRVTCTVLPRTRKVDGVECAVLEVREEIDGNLVELTYDYHAHSKRTGNVYYFGEDVDEVRDGKVVGHGGAWLSGVDGARWGLFVPAVPLLGSRYYQEIAPGVAMDRAEIVDLDAVVETPAGTFKGCLVYEETNPEEPGHVDRKHFSREVGFMVKEEETVLVRFGKK
jgi:uncharacterized membrane protein YkoI